MGLLILLSGLFAYHFYAASNAEVNLDNSIREITSKNIPSLNISYSNIEVSPFSGDILFTDLNIIRNQDIRRARSARFDFSYLDFLNISLFGPEFGLKRINSGKIRLMQVSLTNRASLAELKIDSLALDYRGDLWNLLAAGFKNSTETTSHTFDANGTGFTFSRPDILGVFKADTLLFDNSLETNQNVHSVTGNTSLLSITWNPPQTFSDKYQFFIKGFGYQENNIPFREASAIYSFESETNLLSINKLELQSELFTGSLSGDIRLDSLSFAESQLQETSIQIGNLSPQLKNFLSNAEKLFGIKIPMVEDQLSLEVAGTVGKPAFMVLEN